jgi:hypothetical protein
MGKNGFVPNAENRLANSSVNAGIAGKNGLCTKIDKCQMYIDENHYLET